jgi:hypothetical protein
MHQGCVRWRQRWRGRGAAGWWPTSPSCRWAGRPTTPASPPSTTKSTCLATGSPRAGGTAPAPPAWGWRAKHRWPGSRPCSRAATQTTGEPLGRPHGRNAVPAFDVVLRPTKSVSILYGLGDPATGRTVLQAHHAGLAEAVGYLDGHLGPAGPRPGHTSATCAHTGRHVAGHPARSHPRDHQPGVLIELDASMTVRSTRAGHPIAWRCARRSPLYGCRPSTSQNPDRERRVALNRRS